MARLPGKLLGPLSLATTLASAALAMREHWQLLSSEERRRLAALVRASRGRVNGLSVAERRELSELVRRLELLRLGRRIATSAAPVGRRRRA